MQDTHMEENHLMAAVTGEGKGTPWGCIFAKGSHQKEKLVKLGHCPNFSSTAKSSL